MKACRVAASQLPDVHRDELSTSKHDGGSAVATLGRPNANGRKTVGLSGATCGLSTWSWSQKVPDQMTLARATPLLETPALI